VFAYYVAVCKDLILSLVPNGVTDLWLQLGRDGIQVMHFTGVLPNLAHDFRFVLAMSSPVAVNANISASVRLRHKEPHIGEENYREFRRTNRAIAGCSACRSLNETSK
jgi:hypothetical protein